MTLLNTDTNTTRNEQLFYQENPLSIKYANQNLLLMNVVKEDKEYRLDVKFIKK
jgi:hypothetical protein